MRQPKFKNALTKKLMKEGKREELVEAFLKAGIAKDRAMAITRGTVDLNNLTFDEGWAAAKFFKMPLDELCQDLDLVSQLRNGWNKAVREDLDVFVEDGKIVRGIKGKKMVNPYIKSGEAYVPAKDLTEDRLDEVIWI